MAVVDLGNLLISRRHSTKQRCFTIVCSMPRRVAAVFKKRTVLSIRVCEKVFGNLWVRAGAPPALGCGTGAVSLLKACRSFERRL